MLSWGGEMKEQYKISDSVVLHHSVKDKSKLPAVKMDSIRS